MYCIYENWQADDKAVVHKSNCSFCNNGNGTGRNTEGETNGRWHKGFDTEVEALKFAKSLKRNKIKKCGHCCK